MNVFDEIDPFTLEKRELHLGILATSTMTVMATGLANFMYQDVFLHAAPGGDPVPRRVFFAFCTLSILMIAYLLNRQIVIFRLRRKHARNKKQLTQVRNQASSDLLKNFPGMSRFQDRLSMEFRRCANSHEQLSVVLFPIIPKSDPSDKNQLATIYCEAAKAILMKMRKGDALYLFESGAFGVLLPGFNIAAAKRMAKQFSRNLMSSNNSGTLYSFTSHVINYPEEFGTAREMEQAVRSVLPVNNPLLPSLGGDAAPVDAAILS